MQAPLAAGRWHFVGDGIILDTPDASPPAGIDMTFDVLWRHGSTDVTLATFQHHFDAPATGFDAVLFQADATGPAAAAQPGDLLVLRLRGASSDPGAAYIPNGDGDKYRGRIPFLTLPTP